MFRYQSNRTLRNLLPLIFLGIAVLGCRNSVTNQNRTSASPTQQPRAITADVRLTGAGLEIENTDSIDFTDLNLKLNLKDLGSDDGRAYVSSIPKGKKVTIPYHDFTVGTTRFNPRKTVILTVMLRMGEAGNGPSKLFLCLGKICQPAPEKNK